MPDEKRTNYFHIAPIHKSSDTCVLPYVHQYLLQLQDARRSDFQFLKEKLVFMKQKLLLFCTSQHNILWQEPGKISHMHLRILHTHVKNLYIYMNIYILYIKNVHTLCI